jgi:hypothetical protein
MKNYTNGRILNIISLLTILVLIFLSGSMIITSFL